MFMLPKLPVMERMQEHTRIHLHVLQIICLFNAIVHGPEQINKVQAKKLLTEWGINENKNKNSDNGIILLIPAVPKYFCMS